MGSILEHIAALSTAAGVVVICIQIVLLKRQSQTQFEDTLASEYRSLIKEIPSAILLGDDKVNLDNDNKAKEAIFNYIDLSNHQVFLRMYGRVSEKTWDFWCDGIKHNLSLPAFKEVWDDVKRNNKDIFVELRMLEEGFRSDPRSWKR